MTKILDTTPPYIGNPIARCGAQMLQPFASRGPNEISSSSLAITLFLFRNHDCPMLLLSSEEHIQSQA